MKEVVMPDFRSRNAVFPKQKCWIFKVQMPEYGGRNYGLRKDQGKNCILRKEERRIKETRTMN